MIHLTSPAIRSISLLSALFLFLLTSARLEAQPARNLRVLYPDGGETLAGGTTITIRWSPGERSVRDEYRLEYSTDNGTDWNLIADVERDTTYDWSIPSVAGDHCLVRVTKTRGVAGGGDSVTSFRAPWPGNALPLRAQYSRDGKLVAISQGQHVGVWNVASREWLWWSSTDYVGSPGGIFRVKFDWDDRRLVVTGFSRADTVLPHAEVWDAVTGKRIAYLLVPSGEYAPHFIEVIDGTFFPDDPDKLLVVGRFRSGLFSISSESLVDSTLFGPKYGSCVAHPSRPEALVAHAAGPVELRSTEDWSLLENYDQEARHAEYNSDGTIALFSGKPIQLVDLGTRAELYRIDEETIRDVSGIAESRRLTVWATMSDDSEVIITEHFGEIWVWYRGDDLPRLRLNDPVDTNSYGFLGDLSPDGTQVIYPQRSGEIILYSLSIDDQSDATFTIGGPAPVLSDVDFGPQKVGTSRDSTMAGVVRNDGSVPVTVTSLRFVSGDTAALSLGTPFQPITIPPGASVPVSIVFAPADSGSHQARLEATTDAGVIYGTVRGLGTQGVFERLTSSSQIRYGDHPPGYTLDTTVMAGYNTGNAPLEITLLRIEGDEPDVDALYTLYTQPQTLMPGDTLRVHFAFNPPAVPDTYFTNLKMIDEYENGFIWQIVGGIIDTSSSVNLTSAPGEGGLIAHVAPNPAQNDVIIRIRNGVRQSVTVRILDEAGREIERFSVDESGMLHLNLGKYPSGVYAITVGNGHETEVRKIVIER